MTPYIYSELDAGADEIRIIRLLPGSFNERIKLAIRKVRLHCADSQTSPVFELHEVQATLPNDWRAYITLEGQYLFQNTATVQSFWKHPDPHQARIIEQAEQDAKKQTAGPHPTFEALSYTWGSAANPVSILIQDTEDDYILGQDSFRTLNVTQNLASALQHLRCRDKPRDMWIDAICINQQNNKEKSGQVARMHYIYQLAQRVVIWLGEDDTDCILALSTLERLSEDVEVSRDDYILWNPTYTENNPGSLSAVIPNPELDDEIWHSIFKLFSRPWFSRIWIMQEAAKANRKSLVQCGFHNITWYRFRRGSARFLL